MIVEQWVDNDGNLAERQTMTFLAPVDAYIDTNNWDYNPITALRVAAAQNVDAANRVARHTGLRQAANETGEAFVRRITVAMLEEMGG